MKILVITPHFPTFDIFSKRSEDPRTKFLYDYAVEWVKQGHKILVIHTIPKFPAFFPWVVRVIDSIPGGNRLQLKRFVQNQATVQYSDYVNNGIHIIRVPVPKYIPHREYFQTHMQKLKLQVDIRLKSINWVPDLILSDFLTPSLSVACHAKGQSAVPLFQIFHQSDLRYFRANKAIFLEFLNKTSCFLFRSYSMKKIFQRIGCNAKPYGYMFSGIPAYTRPGGCRRTVMNFLYVGTLRYSKNVHKLMQAFAISSLHSRSSLEIVGSGPDEEELKQLPYTLGIAKRVTFLGKIDREEVFERMRQSDCFVMVSKETFGMVYIEAMSQGCIVVAAKGQGIDGIIVDGENGFLVPLNDVNVLAEIMKKISCLSEIEVSRLSKNAIATASKMKDDILAHNLLEKLKGYVGDEK